MKRVLAVLLAAAVCFGCAGCRAFDGFDYMKAMKLYEEGDYAGALPIFAELGDYADSQTMAQLCKQFVDYADGEAFFAAGDYREALKLYDSLFLYEDSPMKAAQCRYAIGEECLNGKNYAEAAGWYAQLGSYEDSQEKGRQARWMWLWQQLDWEGAAEYPVGEGQVLEISAADHEGRLVLCYRAEGSLLGMTSTDEVKLWFDPDGSPAHFEVSCKSYAASIIWEGANGTVELDSFTGKSYMPIDYFIQTVTMEDDLLPPVSQTEDPAEALLVQAAMAAAQLAIEQQLPALLESTGVEVTVKDLGFLSL